MANKKDGYVLIYRSLFKNDLWVSNEPFDKRSAWIDLIGMAQFQKRTWLVGNDPITLERGQMYVTLRFLSKRWHWSLGKVQRYFDTLSVLKMVTLTSTPNGTLLTLVNYGFFQGDRYTERNANRYTDGTHIDTPTEHIRNKVNKLNNENKKNIGAGDDGDRVYQ